MMGRHFGTEVKGIKCIENPVFPHQMVDMCPLLKWMKEKYYSKVTEKEEFQKK